MREFWLNFGYYLLKVIKWPLALLTVIWLGAGLISGEGTSWGLFILFLVLSVGAFSGYRVLHKKRYNIDLDGTKRYNVHSSVTHYRRWKW